MTVTKERTSLSLSSEALAKARNRASELLYESLSAYVEALVLNDSSFGGAHTMIRDHGDITYKVEPRQPDPIEPPRQSTN